MNIDIKEFENICPRCKIENTYRTFMSGNYKNKEFTFRSFCSNCNSFAYKIVKDPDGNFLDIIEVQFSCNNYIVTLFIKDNKTTIRSPNNMIDIVSIPKVAKFNLTSSDNLIEEKIKTYILFL